MQKKEAQSLLSELQSIVTRDNPDFDLIFLRARMTIKNIFGADTDYMESLQEIKELYDNDATSKVLGLTVGHNIPWKLHALFTVMQDELLVLNEPLTKLKREPQKNNLPKNNKVFIVHGHDNAMREAVARVVSKLGLSPIILNEMPNKGSTGLLDKLSNNSDVSFAIVLLSSDDKGYSKKDGPKNSRSRPRQNVLFELGFFIGKLGKEGVIPLFRNEADFETLSDYLGVTYIDFDLAGNWKFEIVRELKAFGFDVDPSELI